MVSVTWLKWSLKLIFHATFAEVILGWTDFYQSAEPNASLTCGSFNCSHVPKKQTRGVELLNVRILFDGDKI